MKKKNCLLPLMLILALPSCTFTMPDFNPSSSEDTNSHKSHGTIGGDTSSKIVSSSSTQSSSKSSISIDPNDPGYKVVDLTKSKIKNPQDLLEYEGGILPTGKRKVLVIPVEFPDCTASSKGYKTSTIKSLFTGEGKGSNFVSVKDYFLESSYGKLDIQFDVLDTWYKTQRNWSYYRSMTAADIYANNGTESAVTGEQIILNEAIKSLDSSINYKDYDTDNNGTIDSVVMIYTHDYDSDENGDSLAWAWRYWNYLGDPTNRYPGGGYDYYYYDGVYANDYLWASAQFMYDGMTGTQDLDIYTYCHEFSHVLGLDDYYDTEYIYHPMGGYDMMDQAMCDHCAYSKMSLGWLDNVRLINTKSTVTLELKDLTKEGDAIIIANDFDEQYGAYNEYWLVQYYTNNGLNALGGLFPDDGIFVYHIDSTVSYDSKYEGYLLNNNNTSYTDRNGYGTRNNLIEFCPAPNSSSYLYKTNMELKEGLKDNKGESIPYTFHIDSIDPDCATLTFTKL